MNGYGMSEFNSDAMNKEFFINNLNQILTMAKVNWSAGIDSVSGALSKPSKGSQHSCEKMLLATHRVAETTSSDCNRLFIRKKVKRSTPVSRDELQKRERFAEVSRAVATRATNLSTLTTDQQAYLAQKDLPNGKKTFKKYLWALELAAYDAQHP